MFVYEYACVCVCVWWACFCVFCCCSFIYLFHSLSLLIIKSKINQTSWRQPFLDWICHSDDDSGLYVCSERGLDPGYIPERKNGDALEMRTVFEPHYEMLWQRSFPCPLMALDSAEMMGDGLENLVVLTSHGLHIMQVSSECESVKSLVVQLNA